MSLGCATRRDFCSIVFCALNHPARSSFPKFDKHHQTGSCLSGENISVWYTHMLSAKKLVVFFVYRQSFGAAKKEKENKIKLVYAECILMFSSMLFCPTLEGPDNVYMMLLEAKS